MTFLVPSFANKRCVFSTSVAVSKGIPHSFCNPLLYLHRSSRYTKGIIIYRTTCIYKAHYAPTCVEKELVSRHSRRTLCKFRSVQDGHNAQITALLFCIQYAHSPKTVARVSYLAPALPGNTWIEAASMCTCHYLIHAYNDINWKQRPCSSHCSLLHPRRTYLRSAWTRGGDYSHQVGQATATKSWLFHIFWPNHGISYSRYIMATE